MAGFFRDMTRDEALRDVGDGWTIINDTRVGPTRYLAIIEWILKNRVWERGLICLSDPIVTCNLIPQEVAWGVKRSGIQKIIDDGLADAIKVLQGNASSVAARNIPEESLICWPLEIAFGSADDAMLYRMTFL